MQRGYLISLIFLCLFFKSAICQKINEIDFKARPEFTGGFNSNINLLKRSGQDLGYFYRFAFNFNVKIWDIINIPFAFSYAGSQYDFSTVRVNRQFGLSPSYKSITLHLGYRTMNISEFTLNSTQFIGAGIHYASESFPVEVKMMKGELILPLVTFDPAFPIDQIGSNKRNAFAIDIGLKLKNGKTNLSVFKSEDYKKGGELVDSLENKPLEENLVVELSNQTDLSDLVNIDIRFAHSLMTLDKESKLSFYDDYSFYNNLGSLFEVNGTSYFSNAFVGALNFNISGNTVGLRYRKIDPYFRSHGAGFLNNDIEDIMIINSLHFFQNKLSIKSSFGRKQDDIKKENSSYTRNISYGS